MNFSYFIVNESKVLASKVLMMNGKHLFSSRVQVEGYCFILIYVHLEDCTTKVKPLA